MLKDIQDCFKVDKILFTKHASESDLAIIITAYQPVPKQWINFERRKI